MKRENISLVVGAIIAVYMAIGVFMCVSGHRNDARKLKAAGYDVSRAEEFIAVRDASVDDLLSDASYQAEFKTWIATGTLAPIRYSTGEPYYPQER